MKTEFSKEILKALDEIKASSFDGKDLTTSEMEILLLASLLEEEG